MPDYLFSEFVEANPSADLTNSASKFVMLNAAGANAEATVGALSSALKVTSGQWDDLRVPFNTINTGTPNAPDYAKWRDSGAGSVGVYGYSFSATVREEVFFEAQLPHSYIEGSRIAPHCHFVPLTTPTAGQTVRFGLEYTYANVAGVFPVTQTIYADYTFVEGDAQYQQIIGGFDPDIEDANINVSAMFSCRFFRDATVDSYTGEVVVLEFDFHYQIESFGSISEFSKP
jgi:hypothetical protein